MFLLRVFRLSLFCFILAEVKTVEGKRVLSLGSNENKGEFKTEPAESIPAIGPVGNDLAYFPTDRRRWGWFKRQVKKITRPVSKITRPVSKVVNRVKKDVKTGWRKGKKAVRTAARNVGKGVGRVHRNIRRGVRTGVRNVRRGVRTGVRNVRRGVRTGVRNVRKGVGRAGRNIRKLGCASNCYSTRWLRDYRARKARYSTRRCTYRVWGRLCYCYGRPRC